MKLFYQFLTIFFYPFLILLIYFRKILKKEDKDRYKEKILLSAIKAEKNKYKKLIWFHAASIGEVQSIFPIINALNKSQKHVEFLITTVTLSSGNLVKKKIKANQNIKHRYFPVDVVFVIKKFLDIWKPDLVIFVDSEIWPNLIFDLKRRKIPSILVNARITKKTFKRWMLIKSFAKKIFNNFDLCLASSAETKKYLQKLRAKNIKYFGNIKIAALINYNKISNTNDKFLNKKRFWCAASIHKGEEILCLKTHLNIKSLYKDIITIIVPRHISRSRKIKALCDKFNLTGQILNENEKIKNKKEIIIINSFGALLKYLKYSKSVFIGKSTIKKLEQVGGQNPIEAAKLGCKIYHGPYTYNFSDVYDLLKKKKITYKINNAAELSDKLILDLKHNRKNRNNSALKTIDNIGTKILNNSIKEIKKILRK